MPQELTPQQLKVRDKRKSRFIGIYNQAKLKFDIPDRTYSIADISRLYLTVLDYIRCKPEYRYMSYLDSGFIYLLIKAKSLPVKRREYLKYFNLSSKVLSKSISQISEVLPELTEPKKISSSHLFRVIAERFQLNDEFIKAAENLRLKLSSVMRGGLENVNCAVICCLLIVGLDLGGIHLSSVCKELNTTSSTAINFVKRKLDNPKTPRFKGFRISTDIVKELLGKIIVLEKLNYTMNPLEVSTQPYLTRKHSIQEEKTKIPLIHPQTAVLYLNPIPSVKKFVEEKPNNLDKYLEEPKPRKKFEEPLINKDSSEDSIQAYLQRKHKKQLEQAEQVAFKGKQFKLTKYLGDITLSPTKASGLSTKEEVGIDENLFPHLGSLLKEERTTYTCENCNNYIYKLTYKSKALFICKNCLKDN